VHGQKRQKSKIVFKLKKIIILNTSTSTNKGTKRYPFLNRVLLPLVPFLFYSPHTKGKVVLVLPFPFTHLLPYPVTGASLTQVRAPQKYKMTTFFDGHDCICSDDSEVVNCNDCDTAFCQVCHPLKNIGIDCVGCMDFYCLKCIRKTSLKLVCCDHGGFCENTETILCLSCDRNGKRQEMFQTCACKAYRVCDFCYENLIPSYSDVKVNDTDNCDDIVFHQGCPGESISCPYKKLFCSDTGCCCSICPPVKLNKKRKRPRKTSKLRKKPKSSPLSFDYYIKLPLL